MGKRYGKLPSELIGITNREQAFDFDVAILIKGSEIERKANEEEIEKSKNSGKTENKFDYKKFQQQMNQLRISKSIADSMPRK